MKPVIALFISVACFSQPVLALEIPTLEDIPDFVEKPATPAIIKQLRNGGYVLYMRHGNTDTSRPDRQPSVDLNDCSTQRPLTEEGRRIAAEVGQQIRKAKIPLGEIFSSPMCRAKETALAAFGKNFIINNLLIDTSNMTKKEKEPVLETARELLSRPIEGKVNRVVVAHAPILIDLFGYYPKPEASMAIFKPMGDKKFKYIASIAPKQWQTIQP